MNEINYGLELVLCGGFEFISNIPYAINSYIGLGKKFGNFTMTDPMTHDGLIDIFSNVHMGVTTENTVKNYHIIREMQDECAFMAQKRAIEAVDTGKFKEEIVLVSLKDYRSNEYTFEIDKFRNRKSSAEKLKN